MVSESSSGNVIQSKESKTSSSSKEKTVATKLDYAKALTCVEIYYSDACLLSTSAAKMHLLI